MQRILLHVCCANCAIYPVETLRSQSKEVFAFFYNPNIHPYQEYQRRLETFRSFIDLYNLRAIFRDDYDLEGFIRNVVFREERRCHICYQLRLEATAKIAKKGKFDAFTTSLLYSKQQKHELIIETAENISKKEHIAFYYEDFRVGWERAIHISKHYGFYRQQYCGCIYSEKERYHRPKKSEGKRR